MKIIFACVHNAGRSQMAAAFFNELASDADMVAISAGTEPADRVHPEVVEAMKEVGIDLSNAQPQLLTEEIVGQADLLVTMGCGETCPLVPGLRRLDWALTDPRGGSVEQVRAIRDEIKNRVTALLKEEISASLRK